MREKLTEITLSLSDFNKLEAVLDNLPPTDAARQEKAGSLSHALARAMLCHASEMPPDVVTLHSRLTVRLGQRESKTLTLVLPDELQAGRTDLLSVLAPVGTAVLGLTVGTPVLWPMPSGILQQIEVLTLHYQPERDLHQSLAARQDSQGKMRLLPQ